MSARPDWFTRELTRALRADKARITGWVLVRGGDTFMQPERVGLPFYWGRQGKPALYPSHAAATKAALMQGGVVLLANNKVAPCVS